MNEFYVLGVGDNTAVYIDLLESLNFKIKGLSHYSDDRLGEKYLGYIIDITTKALLERETLSGYSFALSMGDNNLRSQLAKEIRDKGGDVPTLIHPSAVVSRYAILSEGVVIHANSTIQANTEIKKDSIVSGNSFVVHGAVVGPCCYIAAGSIIGADAILENNVFIGLGSVITSKKVSRIASNTIIGSGSVVIKSVEESSVLAGNPAKVIRKIY